ncbi:MAG: Re/Si-specific NAD(P)(+) transhydrogenase subunit alpha [Sphaerobacteraceae bacterium]|nr:MAG: Re/Si-specific NAD(P)(+) transhydrogenase subunit alpha [Sphaerobacteraceae bacterium]
MPPTDTDAATKLRVGVPRETRKGETRVALTPDVIRQLSRKPFEVIVERGAGEMAGFTDDAFEAVGAKLIDSAKGVYDEATVILKIQRPTDDEIALLSEGQTLIALLQPLSHQENVVKLAEQKVTALSMDAIPRITRAQSMDVLSSMSTCGGYMAVLLAASHLPKFFPLLMTAAGTIPPAKVLVLGAGVAGLQAIATAKRLGAQVEAFDTRSVVKEQVQSLGATFIDIDLEEDAEAAGGYAKELAEDHIKKEQEAIHNHALKSDVVITTALVPGRRAPILIKEDTVKEMQPGSVILDMAGEMGGNCEVTTPGETTVVHGVTIMSPFDLPTKMPFHASQMYAKNLATLLEHLSPEGEIIFNMEDEITKGVVLTRDGEVLHGPTLEWMKEKEGAS